MKNPFLAHGLTPATLTAIINAPKPHAYMAENVRAAMTLAGNLQGQSDAVLMKSIDNRVQKLRYTDTNTTNKILLEGVNLTSSPGSATAIAVALGYPHLLIEDIAQDEHPILYNRETLCFLVFEDNSFIAFHEWKALTGDYSNEQSFILDNCTWKDAVYDVEEKNAIIHQAYNLVLSDEDNTGESLLDDANHLYAESEDPLVDGMDSDKGWSDKEADEAMETAMLVFAALANTSSAYLELRLESTDGEGGFVIESSEELNDDLYLNVISALVDPNTFTGSTLEYNDGSYDRLSGYSSDATVFSTEFSLNHMTSHEILENKRKFLEMLDSNPKLEPLKDAVKEHFHVDA